MRDIHFSYAMLALACACFPLYGVRTALRGRARHERAEQDGGSVFVGKRFIEFGYWLVNPLVAILNRWGVTPDAVTAWSLLPALSAGVAVSQGYFGLACILATIASLGDTIDGLLARRRGSASDAGEALDAVVDRYVEFFFMGGLVIHYRAWPALCLLALLALFGAFMVSYSTAKAEALGVAPPRGSMRRAERAIYLLFASGLTPFTDRLAGSDAPLVLRQAPMVLAIGLIALVANASVVTRVRAIIGVLRARDADHAVTRQGARVEPVDVAAAHRAADGSTSRSSSTG
ncbi:MAG: CDP-alcohol phosphatidyltransferase family protein [Bacteroidota bacterium]